jgi:5-hydroxyisourate hydrolase
VSLSTHVLDATSGVPASGVAVTVESRVGGRWRRVAEGSTDADGRIRELADLGAGTHRISFDTGGYFARTGVTAFYPEVTVTFSIVNADAHHHVPLLLSPFAFSTYRGS